MSVHWTTRPFWDTSYCLCWSDFKLVNNLATQHSCKINLYLMHHQKRNYNVCYTRNSWECDWTSYMKRTPEASLAVHTDTFKRLLHHLVIEMVPLGCGHVWDKNTEQCTVFSHIKAHVPCPYIRIWDVLRTL